MAHSAIYFKEKFIFIKDGALNKFVMSMAYFLLNQPKQMYFDTIEMVAECKVWIDTQEEMPSGVKDICFDEFLIDTKKNSWFVHCLDQMIIFISSEEMFNSPVVQNVVNRIKTELLT